MYIEHKEPIFTMDTAVEKAPGAAIGFLGFFAAIAFVMPFVVLVFILSSGGGINFGFLLSSLIFFAVGYYLFRMVSWNSSGSEVVTVFEDEVVYQAKTKWLTLEKHKLKLIGCIVVIFDDEGETANYGLRNGEQVVEMKFRAALSEINRLDDILNERNDPKF